MGATWNIYLFTFYFMPLSHCSTLNETLLGLPKSLQTSFVASEAGVLSVVVAHVTLFSAMKQKSATQCCPVFMQGKCFVLMFLFFF